MATGALTEAVIEEVAENLEEAAAVTRRINAGGVGYLLGGIAIGAAIGFYFGHRFNREKLRAEAFAESKEEVEQIREVYMQKAMTVQQKPSVDDVIRERGYGTVETDTKTRPLPPPVPINEPLISRDPDWIWDKELAERNIELPYVIHQNEFTEAENGYEQVTYTYYSKDDVLTGEDEQPLPHADMVVGQNNLKFGHGSDDENIVHVRNDRLQLEMEICRSPGSYAEEVLGLESDQTS